jgi:hypothetical protein
VIGRKFSRLRYLFRLGEIKPRYMILAYQYSNDSEWMPEHLYRASIKHGNDGVLTLQACGNFVNPSYLG